MKRHMLIIAIGTLFCMFQTRTEEGTFINIKNNLDETIRVSIYAYGLKAAQQINLVGEFKLTQSNNNFEKQLPKFCNLCIIIERKDITYCYFINTKEATNNKNCYLSVTTENNNLKYINLIPQHGTIPAFNNVLPQDIYLYFYGERGFLTHSHIVPKRDIDETGKLSGTIKNYNASNRKKIQNNP